MIQTRYEFGDDLYSQVRWGDGIHPPPGEGEGGGEGEISFLLYDGLGSTRSLTNASGAIVQSYNYRPFGEGINHPGELSTNHLFTGEYYDSNLDYYYLRARYYSPGLGRFTGYDPVEDANNKLHKYAYCGNDGFNHLDPSGQFSLIEAIIAIVLLVVALIVAVFFATRAKRAATSTATFISVMDSYISNNHLENAEIELERSISTAKPSHDVYTHTYLDLRYGKARQLSAGQYQDNIHLHHQMIENIWTMAKEKTYAADIGQLKDPTLASLCIASKATIALTRMEGEQFILPGVGGERNTVHHFFFSTFASRYSGMPRTVSWGGREHEDTANAQDGVPHDPRDIDANEAGVEFYRQLEGNIGASAVDVLDTYAGLYGE